MGPILFSFRRRPVPKSNPHASITPKLSAIDTKRMPLLNTDELIATVGLENTIRSIKRLVSVSEKHWNVLYKPALDSYIELCQLAPASVAHHHAGPGGLIAHTLESVDFGLRLRKPLVLPRNADPDTTARQEHVWTYAVFCAVLLHDNGKLATTTRLRLEDGRLWSPLAGSPVKSGCRYYSIEFVQAPYKLHSRVANAGLRIFPESGIAWLSQFPEIMSQVIAYLYGDLYESGIVGEIAHAADGQSVAANLKIGGDRLRFTNAPSIPLVDHLIIGLRDLLGQNELKLNTNGADGWVTDQYAYMVCGTVSNKLLEHLRKQGITNVPTDNNRIFDILQEHGFVLSNPDGKAIHQTKIIGPRRSYEFNLTMLKFETSRLFPPFKRPQSFVGEIVEYHEGRPIAGQASLGHMQRPSAQLDTPTAPLVAETATASQLTEPTEIKFQRIATDSIDNVRHELEASNAATNIVMQQDECASTTSNHHELTSNSIICTGDDKQNVQDEEDPYSLSPTTIDTWPNGTVIQDNTDAHLPQNGAINANGAEILISESDATAYPKLNAAAHTASVVPNSTSDSPSVNESTSYLGESTSGSEIIWHDVTPGLDAASVSAQNDKNANQRTLICDTNSEPARKQTTDRAISFDDIRPSHLDDEIGLKFMDWLARMLRNGKLAVNRRDASIHIVPEGMLAVSPRIFKEFCSFYDLNAKSDGTSLNSDEAARHVQKRVEKLRKNIKTSTGMSVHVYVISGKNRISSVNGFLFDPISFYGHIAPPAPNPLLVKATV